MRRPVGPIGCRAISMIELLLNVVWLTIVVAAFVVVPRRSSRATLGIACILVLLFPIISVSDDLALDGNSLEEALAIVVAILMLAVGLLALARVEHVLSAPALILVAIPSDPRSPPRA
jgi:lipopolysaccharide export LptBFGC system permease protein LptF